MAKSLKGVIRLRQYEVDQCRRALADLYRMEAALNAEDEALDAAYARETAFMAQHPDLGLTLGGYVRRHQASKAAVAQRRAHLDQAIHQAQDALAEAYRAQKSLEVTQEARDRRAELERGRKDQAILDDIGLDLYRRRGGVGPDRGRG